MIRRLLAVTLLVALASCQDYNFNPVGKCVLEAGSARIPLSSVSAADILFVVDDSGSMASEQQRLADNFGSFISALAQTQAQRKASGLDPLDFHIAITTSSVFEAHVPQTSNAVGAPPASTCGQPTAGTCNVSAPWNAWTAPYTYACTAPSAPCVDVIDEYWAACSAASFGLGSLHAAYPAGDFVAYPSVIAPTNPRVLHFTKDLAWETWGTSSQDAAITSLVAQFQQNVKVGACGSGMEQHLEAGRLAVQKAMGGTQPGMTAGEWPHPGAKMVVVWIGDEDDCSNPKDPNKSLAFMNGNDSPGNDACTQDEASAAAGQPYKMFPIQEYADFFTSLDRPFSAAFIYSADPSSCEPDANGNIVCETAVCACQCPPSCNGACGPTASGACNIPAECSGKSTGSRFHDLSAAFRAKGISTLDGSVCDWNFGQTLQRIAELAKPPAGLTLPTQPASTQVALLRIESSGGQSSRLCTGPGPGLDWQFVDCQTGQPAATGTTTSCIAINHATGHCEANPGETYIAQYLGIVPPADPTRAKNPAGGCAVASDCSDVLGGDPTQWTCDGASGQTRGTCLCSSGG